jgi:lysophospholipase L1-like esterase
MRKLLSLIICITLLSTITLKHVNAQKREFSNLKRYSMANENLSKPSKTEKRVVFMGNSITDSWSTDFFKNNKSYINRGISGQTTPQMLIRFRADVINLEPKVVVILAGTNDIAGNTGPSTLEMITNNIESMCELAVANNIKVILSSVLPANIYLWSKGIEPADIIIELNKRLKKYAKKKGHIYLDYYSSMVDDEKGLKSIYASDPVHPNKEGYKVMEVLVEKAIKKAFAN